MSFRNDEDFLSALIDEKLVDISDPFFSASDYLNLPKVSDRFYSFYYPEHQRALNVSRLLLSHGALGELDQAKCIWKLFPDLLTSRGTVYFPNRSYIDADGNPLSQPIDIPFYINPGRPKYTNRTFYQILLRNAEFEAAEEAGQMMSQEEKQEQFLEIFPDGEIKAYNFDLYVAKRLLEACFDEFVKDAVIGKVDMDKMSDTSRRALYAIFDYANLQWENETGLIFDPRFYEEAIKLYDDKRAQFQDKWGKYPLWCTRVEEWLKACLGTGYLRPLSQGAANPLTGLGCVLADGSSYFPSRRPSNSIPGFHFRVNTLGSVDTRGRFPLDCIEVLGNIMSNKDESRDRLYAAIYAPGTRWCPIL